MHILFGTSVIMDILLQIEVIIWLVLALMLALTPIIRCVQKYFPDLQESIMRTWRMIQEVEFMHNDAPQ